MTLDELMARDTELTVEIEALADQRETLRDQLRSMATQWIENYGNTGPERTRQRIGLCTRCHISGDIARHPDGISPRSPGVATLAFEVTCPYDCGSDWVYVPQSWFERNLPRQD